MARNTPANPFYHPIIDCDIHNELPSLNTLIPYLEEHWVAYINESAFVGPNASDYPARAPTSARKGTKPKNGPPGSDFELLKKADTGHLGCRNRDLDLCLSRTKRTQRRPVRIACNRDQPVANRRVVKQRRPIARLPRSAQPKSSTRRERDRTVWRPSGLCAGHCAGQIISTLWQARVRPIIRSRGKTRSRHRDTLRRRIEPTAHARWLAFDLRRRNGRHGANISVTGHESGGRRRV